MNFGCGGEKLYRVSGKVMFAGKPVPAGKIYFAPDGKKNNSGSAGYAEIVGGSFDTSAAGGRGTVGGPTVITIEGLDPAAKAEKADKSGEVLIKPLFPRYTKTVELPMSDSTQEFVVQIEPGTNPAGGAGGMIIP
ncbi:hypothetical protein FRUB_08080 [Fimbriiglobus ruber]|uniref:Uncharacterized protein n=1 Tax=Fimbriiglobus ruber TaxID=1908690 RepID=A0A225DHF0_9BACT|nr:hypothetical protein FRUB_08080 [Fimbriiglobus ruber]